MPAVQRSEPTLVMEWWSGGVLGFPALHYSITPSLRSESSESRDRYSDWAKDKEINLTGEQQLFPYLWSIIVKADLMIPKATLPLSKITEELPAVISRGDSTRARQIMEDCMKYLMVYDYGRDRIWYDSGPMVESLSPLQIARFFVRDTEGSGKSRRRPIYSQYDDGRWGESTSADLTDAVDAQLQEIKKQLKPTAAQLAVIRPVIEQNMALEHLHSAELKKSLDRVQKLVASDSDGVEMLQALRGMFFHHRMFLIHQSLISMPKYSVLLENGDVLGYAQWFYKKRVGQYKYERVGRQLAAATRYMWRPSPYYEAEYAAFEGCHWTNATPGYSGTGYVVFDKPSAGHIEWEVTVAAEGKYRLLFRYSLHGGAEEPLSLVCGDNPLDVPVIFSPGGSNGWATNTTVVSLPSGSSKIRLSARGNGNPDLDYLHVEPVEPSAAGSNGRVPPTGKL
jgi:hypothetical protein